MTFTRLNPEVETDQLQLHGMHPLLVFRDIKPILGSKAGHQLIREYGG